MTYESMKFRTWNPTGQLHDVGGEKNIEFRLNCSPKSLYKESVREQLLELQKNMSHAVDEAHCVLH